MTLDVPPGIDCAQMLGLAAGGDQDAFAAVYDVTINRAFGLALRVVRDRGQAEEVAQEAYLHLWTHAARFDPARGSAISWILMAVHGAAVNRVRSSSRRAERESVYERRATVRPSVSDDHTHDAVGASLDGARVRLALAGLSPVQRQAVELAYFEGLSHSEVAARAGIPLGTAKTRIRSALISLRELMKEI
ncbi:sigma-70 family RNA polymerase sigma factor [Nocardioides lijunqiniae]|uniref:sigma-70 family RNA polymerase sigma factor n=1 Tax=Nocardioides lijunqiniae TaxID=2760832 RepID=UPI0018778609|nr:sigma-70 family RNA polymerase sigma factor [Nocardioides lijunqiniae]